MESPLRNAALKTAFSEGLPFSFFPQSPEETYSCTIMFPADTTFTVFDVETTGLNSLGGDRIVEVAGVRIEGGIVQDNLTFSSYVNPQRTVPWEAKAVHRIPEQELSKAPPIEEVLPRFLSFAEGSLLIAHNAEFDMGFLMAEKEGCWGYIDLPECLCTLCLSRNVQPHEYRHTLDVLALRLGFPLPQDRHHALPDVILTAKVFLKLLEVGKIRTLAELRERAAPMAAGKTKQASRKSHRESQRASLWR
ncbi:MAG: 3'-5' exonuclease [Patescibacteria group bacterium]